MHGRPTLRRSVVAFVTVIVAANAVAYLHARALHRFADSGTRTDKPEKLSTWERLKVLATGVNIPRPSNRHAPVTPFETLGFASADGTRLEAWWIQQKHPKGSVLLVHGYSASKSSQLDEARAFADLGFSTLLLDCRGSGGSGGFETTVGVREAEDVQAAVAELQRLRPRGRVVLFGQSMGGAAILRAVGVLGVRADAIVVESVFDRLLSTVANRFHSMRVPDFPAAHMLVFWGGIAQGIDGFAHNPAEYAEEVRVPTLILHGAQDLRVSGGQARSVFDRLAGAKRFVSFPNAGHQSLLGADSDLWRRSVSEFLATLPGEA